MSPFKSDLDKDMLSKPYPNLRGVLKGKRKYPPLRPAAVPIDTLLNKENKDAI